VLAVQLSKLLPGVAQTEKRNAFGEPILSDPMVDVVVSFSDGRVAMATGFLAAMVPVHLELAEAREALAGEMAQKLPGIVGRTVYAVAGSRLYKPESTLDELAGNHPEFVKLWPHEIPLLQPISIARAEFLPGQKAVLLKLILPGGHEAIGYTSLAIPNPEARDFLSRVCAGFLTAIPRKLTPSEIERIRHRQVRPGMSYNAVIYALGQPEAINDWGRDGTQLVYDEHTVFVYLNNAGYVEDMHVLN
jgi:hypothetical protein